MATNYESLWTDAHRQAAARIIDELLTPIHVEWIRKAAEEDPGYVRGHINKVENLYCDAMLLGTALHCEHATEVVGARYHADERVNATLKKAHGDFS